MIAPRAVGRARRARYVYAADHLMDCAAADTQFNRLNGRFCQHAIVENCAVGRTDKDILLGARALRMRSSRDNFFVAARIS